MQLALQDFTTLVRTMSAGVQGSARILLDLTAGSVLRALLEANASVALWLQWLIVQVLSATRAATSVGPDLDSWVGDFGLARLPAQPATTTAVFSRITPGLPASIPVGAQVKTADAAVTFTVLADPANPAYSAADAAFALPAAASSIAVPVQAVMPGAIGNVQPGAISLLASAMPGIDAVTNPAAAAGGMDAEPDAALRSRFANFIDSRARATPAAIGFTIMSLRQGLSYVLAENADPSGAARPGFFTVTVDDGSGTPPATLVATVAAALDAVRPVGTQFAVQPPILLTANITLAIATPASLHATAQANVAAAIEAFVASLPIGAALRLTRLAAVAYAADTSVTDITGLAINDAGDLVPATSGIVRPGTVTVN